MLYIEDLNLVFIHIPKNAGQSVRNALGKSAKLSFGPIAKDLKVSEAEAEHLMEMGIEMPGLGTVQPEHVPLSFVESHFPNSWSAISAARSFILARPPRDRFFSALMQRLREYGGAGAIRADDPIVSDEARRVCDWLAGRGPFCDMEFIHFSRQVDYAEVRGERIVKTVFPIDRIDAAADWLEAEIGLRIDVTHDHARREPKKWAKSIQPTARFIGRKLMPRPIKRALYPIWVNSRAFANASGRYQSVRLDADVERFIDDYYAADAALYEEAKRTAAAKPNLAVA